MIEDKGVLRKWDFISSIVLIVFSLWVIYKSLQMPIGNEVVNGVKSEWFTSPALMPLIVGTSILIMSISLMVIATREGAIELLKKGIVRKDGLDIKQACKSLTIYYSIFGFVFFLISYVDYYIGVMLFLSYLITLFYIDNDELWPRLGKSYIVFTVSFFLLTRVGMFSKFSSLADIISILYIGWVVAFTFRYTRGDKGARGRLRTSIVVSGVMSCLVCTIFSFVLMVTPPRQGGLIMNHAENLNAYVRDMLREEDPNELNLDDIDLDDIESSNTVDINSLLGN